MTDPIDRALVAYARKQWPKSVDLLTDAEILHAADAEQRTAMAAAIRAAVGEPVGWIVDWPNEPKLGRYFAEGPSTSKHDRSRALYALALPDAQPKPAEPAEPPLAVRTAPSRIWLQVGDSESDLDLPFPTSGEDSDGVTWCSDPVTDAQVEYVRVDLAALWGDDDRPRWLVPHSTTIRCLHAAIDRIYAGDEPAEIFADFGWSMGNDDPAPKPTPSTAQPYLDDLRRGLRWPHGSLGEEA